jgi:hypothetical protein
MCSDAESPADRDTDHRSLFGMVDYELTEQHQGHLRGPLQR